MKKKLLIMLAALAAVASLNTGCTTTGQPNQAAIDATAVILRNAARSGAAIAIQQNPEDAKYFQLAADSMSTFLLATNYNPGAFQTALMAAVGTGVLTNTYVSIGLGTVIDLYQLYFGLYVKGQVNGNEYAGQFLTAIETGFYQALGKPVPTLKGRLKAPSSPCPVLPRPMASLAIYGHRM